MSTAKPNVFSYFTNEGKNIQEKCQEFKVDMMAEAKRREWKTVKTWWWYKKRWSYNSTVRIYIVCAALSRSIFNDNELRHFHNTKFAMCLDISTIQHAILLELTFDYTHGIMCCVSERWEWTFVEAIQQVPPPSPLPHLLYIFFRFKVTWWYCCYSVCSHPLSFYLSKAKKKKFLFKHFDDAVVVFGVAASDVVCSFHLNSSYMRMCAVQCEMLSLRYACTHIYKYCMNVCD